MGTKEKPGIFDCYHAAAPDEPMFVLLARDIRAPVLVEEWARQRTDLVRSGARPNTPDEWEKIQEAWACAKAMKDWYALNRK